MAWFVIVGKETKTLQIIKQTLKTSFLMSIECWKPQSLMADDVTRWPWNVGWMDAFPSQLSLPLTQWWRRNFRAVQPRKIARTIFSRERDRDCPVKTGWIAVLHCIVHNTFRPSRRPNQDRAWWTLDWHSKFSLEREHICFILLNLFWGRDHLPSLYIVQFLPCSVLNFGFDGLMILPECRMLNASALTKSWMNRLAPCTLRL